MDRDAVLKRLASGGHLIYEDLTGVDLSHVNFTELGIDCRGGATRLRKARFVGSVMHGCDFAVADLQEADFSEADLFDANFTEADLTKAVFRAANLYRANLFATNLREADLRRANLRETYLGDADLRGAKLDGAVFDTETVLPDETNWEPGVDITVYTRQSTDTY
jgi:uncharacterized protein YjbI with pentapeptide repeats